MCNILFGKDMEDISLDGLAYYNGISGNKVLEHRVVSTGSR